MLLRLGKKSILLVVIVVVLASCTTMELTKSVVMTIYKHTMKNKQTGYYKLGKPYKVLGEWYYPQVDTNYNEIGIASWYGDKFDGNLTANGEVFDKNDISAAHKTLPLPSMVRVTNLENGRTVLLRVNDRGPYVGNRIIDLSEKAAKTLDIYKKGLGKVRVEFDKQATDMMFADKSHANYKRPESHKGVRKIVAKSPKHDGLYVQIAAYNNRESALETANKLKSSFKRVVIHEVRVRDKIIFRVRIGKYKSEARADNAVIKASKLGYGDAIVVY